jgi:hypothetical protein
LLLQGQLLLRQLLGMLLLLLLLLLQQTVLLLLHAQGWPGYTTTRPLLSSSFEVLMFCVLAAVCCSWVHVA